MRRRIIGSKYNEMNNSFTATNLFLNHQNAMHYEAMQCIIITDSHTYIIHEISIHIDTHRLYPGENIRLDKIFPLFYSLIIY